MQVHDFTIHWTKGAITRKMGTCCILRRSFEGCSILVWLVKSTKILNVSGEALEKFLKYNNLNVRKNSTKSAKIRALMKLPQIVQECQQSTLDRLEALLVAAEERRSKKNTTSQKDEDQEDEMEKDEAENPMNDSYCSIPD